MAVQQNKKSPSKRGMHRSHDRLEEKSISISKTGIAHRPHHIDSNGRYNNRQVINVKED